MYTISARNTLNDTLSSCALAVYYTVLLLPQMFTYLHNKEMDTESVAAMLATILYYRRFFPYYVYNIVAGLDTQGEPFV